MQVDDALSIQDADMHPVGVLLVDSAVEFVLDGVEFHEKASLVACCSLLPPLSPIFAVALTVTQI